jgi:hypothetical protein
MVAINSVQNLWSSCLISKKLKIKIYKTAIFPVVLHGCKTWSLTLREEHRLKVFENRVVRRILGPNGEEDKSWRKLHNDELHSLYSSPNIDRVIKSRTGWLEQVACMEEGRSVYRVFGGGGLEGKRPIERCRCRRKDNIKMDLRETGINEENWVWLAQDSVQLRIFVNTVMNFQVP